MLLIYLHSRGKDPAKKSSIFHYKKKKIVISGTTKLTDLRAQSQMDMATYHINNCNNFVKFEELPKLIWTSVITQQEIML
jgi:hypothetical protein